VIDQYRTSRDEHGNLSSDPNRPDDEQYIVRIVGQVVQVSLETLKIIRALPELKFP
jgi:predicted helicase